MLVTLSKGTVLLLLSLTYVSFLFPWLFFSSCSSASLTPLLPPGSWSHCSGDSKNEGLWHSQSWHCCHYRFMQQKVLMLTSSGLNKSQINVSWISFVQFMLGSVTLQLIFLWIWRPKADKIVIYLHFGESFTRPYMILQNFTCLVWKPESIQRILNKLT